MKLPAFDYLAPATVGEAVDALAAAGRDARVLAGGQSLLLDMRLGRARPDALVDINGITGLGQVRVEEGALVAGALVRHRAFESAGVAPGPLGRLLSLAVADIAHPPIRARGTMAGSLAWAHPASEWCAMAVALDAEVELRGPAGERVAAARDFFLGPHATARAPAELITAVRVPLLDAGTGVAFAEHRRTAFCFAQVAVVTALTVVDGVVAGARIGLAGCADRPVRARAAERSLLGAAAAPPEGGGTPPPGHPFAQAGRIAAEHDAAPVAEPYADPEYRRQAIAVLVARTLSGAVADLRAHGEADREAGGAR
ncbi:carbon-monoxide dehydrogenase medium subunit [Sphaerisporangium melleum]|uniref:Carbon-monoxide dehydrogenase medium subunit n=1 Tax=Sphaerisporangium melleum TaxID=321316 RepID=A0A917R158_9ACTN|nr:FAD binding domain-containing protein [Sphaerisporangium melleum]GGK83644.1 carbon-monoxide dehydrogenase medium subunit [Sphaerisporangium melleum]GII69299.1 carbon-monoxide dehydrogenase medium subunit [Sphaerisporangium melleum]